LKKRNDLESDLSLSKSVNNFNIENVPSFRCIFIQTGYVIELKSSKRKKRFFDIFRSLKNFSFKKSIENNLDSMAKSKYELINSQLSKLLSLHGEYTFVSCSNVFLNRGNYSLNLVSNNYLIVYK